MATDASSAPDQPGAPGDDPTPPGPSRGRAALASLRAAVEEPTSWSDRCAEALAAQVRARPATAVVVGVVVAVLVTGGAALVWSHRSELAHPGSSATDPSQASVGSTDGTDPTSSDPTGAEQPATSSAAGAGSSSELVVQVGGAVVRPGVYHLASGARVADLVARAGGLAADADGDRVDQAAALVDGTLIYVPRVGQTDLPDPVVGGGGGDSSSSDGSATSGAPLDLNTATATQLDTLPGVGPATAAAIVNYRRQHGPFRQIADLADVTGIGPAKLAQIRPHVRV